MAHHRTFPVCIQRVMRVRPERGSYSRLVHPCRGATARCARQPRNPLRSPSWRVPRSTLPTMPINPGNRPTMALTALPPRGLAGNQHHGQGLDAARRGMLDCPNPPASSGIRGVCLFAPATGRTLADWIPGRFLFLPTSIKSKFLLITIVSKPYLLVSSAA